MFNSQVIIVDTSTLVEGLLSPDKKSPSAQIISLAITGKIRLAICEETFTEMQETIAKTAIKLRARPQVFARFISWYKYNALKFDITNEISGLCRDPNDDTFLELASVSQASFLVTRDKDLLKVETFENCKIVRPPEFLETYLNQR